MNTLLMPIVVVDNTTTFCYYRAIEASRKRRLAKSYVKIHKVIEMNQILSGQFFLNDDRDPGRYIK